MKLSTPSWWPPSSSLASLTLCLLLIDTLTRRAILFTMALPRPQQERQKYHADIDTSKRNVTRVEARLRDKVELTCVIPESQEFRAWRFRGEDARQVPGITNVRETHNGLLSEKLVINHFHLGLAGEYDCVRAKEATPHIETSSIIDLYLVRDGLENIVDAASSPTTTITTTTTKTWLTLFSLIIPFFITAR